MPNLERYWSGGGPPPAVPPVSMLTTEIAELTSKAHKNILADVRKMLTELDIDCAEFSAQYRDPTGRALPCFNLPKREVMILLTGYSIPLRAAVIDRLALYEAEALTRIAAPLPAVTMTDRAKSFMAAVVPRTQQRPRHGPQHCRAPQPEPAAPRARCRATS